MSEKSQTSIKTIQGSYEGSGKHFTLVASRFNDFIVSKLIEGAIDCLTRHGTELSNIELIRVPGAWEIPAVVGKVVARLTPPAAVICLGAVIRGDTPHFDYVAAEVSKGIAQIGLHCSIPVVYGILTTDTVDQAVDRAGTKSGNRGWDAAITALELSDLYGKLK